MFEEKNQEVELLTFNYFFSPVLGWPNGLYHVWFQLPQWFQRRRFK
jgi:hypothetical protein